MPTPVIPNEENQMPPRPRAQQAPAPKPGKKKDRPGLAAHRAKKGLTTTGKASGGTEPIAREQSQQWAINVLRDNMSANPYFQRLMDPGELDVRNNPNLQPVIDNLQREMQEDWLGNTRALDARTEATGRGGSPLAAALRARETEETQEAFGQAAGNIYAGAYENARNRQMQGLGQMLSTQAQAAGIPIAWNQADTARKGVNVQRYGIDKQFQIDQGRLGIERGRLGLARQEFKFNAQQDAVNDYMGLLAMLGGMGGTTTDTAPGQYMPTQNPFGAAVMGGWGGYLQGQETFGVSA